MEQLEFLFFKINDIYEFIISIIFILSFLVSFSFLFKHNDDDFKCCKKDKIRNFIISLIAFIISCFISFFAYKYYFYELQDKDIVRMIDKGYINKDSAELILIKTENFKVHGDYKKITYYLVNQTMKEAKNKANYKSKESIKMLQELIK